MAMSAYKQRHIPQFETLEPRRLLSAATVQLLLPDASGIATPNKGVDNVLICPNARYVAFQTKSNNVLPGITDSDATKADIYLQDRLKGTLRLVSFAAAAPNTTATGTITELEFSPDSRFILIYGQSTNLTGATATGTYLYDIFTNTNVRVSGNAASTSQDGFVTTAGQTTGLAYEAGNAFLY